MKNEFVINAIPEDKKITVIWEEDMRSFFWFFKLPLQITIGGYAAFMVIAATVAIMEHYTEGDDDLRFCGDLEIEIGI